MWTVYRWTNSRRTDRVERLGEEFLWFLLDWGNCRSTPIAIIASMCGGLWDGCEMAVRGLWDGCGAGLLCLHQIPLSEKSFLLSTESRSLLLSLHRACHAAVDNNATMWTWFRKNTSICCVCMLPFQDLWMNKLQMLQSPESRWQAHVWNFTMKSIRCSAVCLSVVLPKYFLQPCTQESVTDVLPLSQLL